MYVFLIYLQKIAVCCVACVLLNIYENSLRQRESRLEKDDTARWCEI